MDKQQKEIEEGEKQYCSHCKMNRKIGLFSENHKTCDLCREKMKIYSQTWRDNHKEEISEINKDYGMKICVCSVCDCEGRLKHKARHEKTKKHIDNLKKNKVEDNWNGLSYSWIMNNLKHFMNYYMGFGKWIDKLCWAGFGKKGMLLAGLLPLADTPPICWEWGGVKGLNLDCWCFDWSSTLFPWLGMPFGLQNNPRRHAHISVGQPSRMSAGIRMLAIQETKQADIYSWVFENER